MELKAFTSYKKREDSSWYVIIDLVYDRMTDSELGPVTQVMLMKVATEEKHLISATDFEKWVQNGLIERAVLSLNDNKSYQ
ncbi:MAG: hypothetical protein ACYC1Q_07700 [Bacteroidia bacterium]